MSRDNGWRLKYKCFACGWIGKETNVCPSCGWYSESMSTVVARWVSALKWYHIFCVDIGNRGHWEEKK